jgi:DNA-binding XRE family transcriptional regulator
MVPAAYASIAAGSPKKVGDVRASRSAELVDMAIPAATQRVSPPHRTPPSALRLRRLGLGLTLEEVALAAGLNRQWVGVLERGGASPRWNTALALAGVLGCDPQEIFPPENGCDPEQNRVTVTTELVGQSHHATNQL